MFSEKSGGGPLHFLALTSSCRGSINSSKENLKSGVAIVDFTGNIVNFDSEISNVEKNCFSFISRGSCSSGGIVSQGFSCGDFLVVSTPNKPNLGLFQLGKSRQLYTCPTQEIITALSQDSSGQFIFGGTKKGTLYVWNIFGGDLICSVQIHFQKVNKLYITSDNQFLISASNDSTVRIWFLHELLESSLEESTILPFW